MPVTIEFPIVAADVPKLDAVLVTHSDNSHYSVPTCRDLAQVTGEYHSTQYVASLMKQEDFPAYGHDIGDHFAIGPVRVEFTPADHAWQNAADARPTPPYRPAAVTVPPPEGPLHRGTAEESPRACPGRHDAGGERPMSPSSGLPTPPGRVVLLARSSTTGRRSDAKPSDRSPKIKEPSRT
jgi:hypothetical protein